MKLLNKDHRETNQYDKDLRTSDEALPSRTQKHKKPLSIFEKPVFSLIIFILFILIVGGIFFYYNFWKVDETNNKETSRLNSVGQSEPASSPTNDDFSEKNNDKTEETKTQIPVIPVIGQEEEETSTNAEETSEEENSNQTRNIIHVVVHGDTLYKIAKKYYGKADQSIYNIIKQANGLIDDNIVLKSELIIPNPSINP